MRITAIAGGPARATLELARPSFVTVLSVTPDRIEAITPVTGMMAELVGAGARVVSLERELGGGNSVGERFGAVAETVLPDDITAAELQEYNRCMANARRIDAARRESRRRIVGRDSAGRPIYDPTPVPPVAGEWTAESQCMANAQRRRGAAATPTPTPVAAQPGRYLLVFASDASVSHTDVLRLDISEGDPRSIAATIGVRLFEPRQARWAVAYTPW